MPSIPHIIRMRRRRWNTCHHTPIQRGGLVTALLISLTILVISFSLTALFIFATRNLPSPETIALQLEPPDGLLLRPTRFYDRTGVHLIHTVENPAIEKRQYLPLDTGDEESSNQELLPSNLVSATIAISDPTFWSNPGFSIQGIREGAHTTIAQKVVLNLLLLDEPPSMLREIRERVLASQIIHEIGRVKVMEWYLNNSDYGSLAYGAQAAAQVYFGKTAPELNLAEASILAATAESPELNPFDSPLTALERGKIVIDAMAGQGLINAKQAAAAKNTEVNFQEPVPSQNILAPAFIDLAWEYLSKTIPIDRLKRGGFDITTTLDYDLQTQTSCTTRIHLARIHSESGTNIEKIADTCPASQLLPTLNLDRDSSGNTSFGKDLSANVVVFDPVTGQILALVAESPSVLKAGEILPHSPGSLTTPFIYLTAFTRGFNPASLVWDIPLDESGLTTEETGQQKGPMRLRNALANDHLIPAIKVLQQIGIENVRRTAGQLGLTSFSIDVQNHNPSNCPECQFVLRGDEITLIEAVQAFGVLANQGFLIGQPSGRVNPDGLEPIRAATVLNVVDATNRTEPIVTEVQTRPVISSQLAYLMTHILSDETARWSSLGHPNPLEIGRPTGAKMGKTTDGNDVWTVGFTPQLVVGVWMGVPPLGENLQVPPKVASTLWYAVIQSATQDVPVEDWQVPASITTLDICDPSGMLPTLQCPTIVSEVFLSDQVPTLPDTLYQSYQINKETDRLATVFTPPNLIEERIYLNVPPNASAWAESIGLETPPETYDVIYTPAMSPNAQIEYPSMFGTVHGLVTVKGSASGEDFISYRLQTGEGLNPTGWTVVEGDRLTPVTDGILGTWDTSGLNGLYALQLIVLRENQRVDTATIQVTLDNLPPTVNIPYPGEGDSFISKIDKTITFLVEASDNLGIAKVEYKIDNRLVVTQIQPPFAYPWQSEPGEHTLTVKATDRGGNNASTSVTFQVE
jgi:membrane carboxypeptidase/penicillin-binding protein